MSFSPRLVRRNAKRRPRALSREGVAESPSSSARIQIFSPRSLRAKSDIYILKVFRKGFFSALEVELSGFDPYLRLFASVYGANVIFVALKAHSVAHWKAFIYL